jgi:hypothetical protein
MKQKEGEREQDAGEIETERVWVCVCVCVRKVGWLQEEVASVVKMTVEENRPFGIRKGLR